MERLSARRTVASIQPGHTGHGWSVWKLRIGKRLSRPTRSGMPPPAFGQAGGHPQRRGNLAERGRLLHLWYDDDVRGGRPDHLDDLRLAPLPALKDVVGQQAYLHRRHYDR